MLGTYYYHEILRKTIIAFGTIFNDIHIRHRDGSGKETNDMRVPLAYGPMQKFLARLEQQADSNRAVQITLPRMSFEIISIQYDAGRQLQKTNTFQQSGSTNALRNKFYTFNGSKYPHETAPYRGERYTLVFYST